jgi:hypothetical protein
MDNPFKNLSATTKGYLILTGGIILLLHTLRILEVWLNYILIAGALFMIGYGFVKSGLYDKLLKMLKKN